MSFYNEISLAQTQAIPHSPFKMAMTQIKAKFYYQWISGNGSLIILLGGGECDFACGLKEDGLNRLFPFDFIV